MSEPLSAERLAEIRERSNKLIAGFAASAVPQIAYDRAVLVDEVDRLSAELAARHPADAETLADQTLFREMTVKDGGINIELIPPRELALQWVHCARSMLGDAPNYSETPVEFEVGLAGEPERYVLIVQRVGRLTPHAARLAAEAEAERLRAELDRRETALERLVGVVAHDRETSACRKRAEWQASLSPCQQTAPEGDWPCEACDLLKEVGAGRPEPERPADSPGCACGEFGPCPACSVDADALAGALADEAAAVDG